MFVHFLLCFFVVIANIFSSLIKLNENGRKYLYILSFILIFLFLALRFEYGNDYNSYLWIYENIQHNGVEGIDERIELGWILLNKSFLNLNFYYLIAFLSFFHVFIAYFFIKKYVNSKFYWLSLFVYLIDINIMLMNLTALRQSVAISFYILFVDSLIQNKYFKSLFFALIGINFHGSSAVVFVLTFILYLFKWVSTRFYSITILFLFLFLFLFGDFLLLKFNFLFNYFDKYSDYSEFGNVGSGIGLFINFIFLIFYSLALLNSKNNEETLILKIFMMKFLLIPLSLNLIMLSRLAFFFDFLSIVSVYLVVKNIYNFYLKVIFLLLYLIWYLIGYFRFFFDPVWTKYFFEYKTILTFL